MPKKEFDPEDPLEFFVVEIEGDFDEMAKSIVEEFVLLGYDREMLWKLFRDPFYRSTHTILQFKGEEYVDKLIASSLAYWQDGVETD